ncbi:hypothetical protein GCM10027446_18550 [Angustibacter peucedani]
MSADRADVAEELALDALRWVLGQAQDDGTALRWTTHPEDDEIDPTLYSGAAGTALALLEAFSHTGSDHFADAAVRAARGVAADLSLLPACSLYFGTTGAAVALHAVAAATGDETSAAAVRPVLDDVRRRFDGERWADQFELLGGNAGIALGALACDDLDLAVLAVEPYSRTTEPTSGGVQWEVRQGTVARFHHVSHGTLGIALALALVGRAAGRADLVGLGLLGAAGVVSRDESGGRGFLVPHSDPQHRPELVERFSYGWCHGPAGDAQAFRALHDVTGDAAWAGLADRCWVTVAESVVPQRVRPGFWDNNGRCCGTAGVLALASDRLAEGAPDDGFAATLVDDLALRATRDAEGTRWSNHEHRATPSDLPPRTGWAMGAAGIARELLRYARVSRGGDPAYAVAWPDHLPPRAPAPRTSAAT